MTGYDWLYLQTLHSDPPGTNQNVLCPVYHTSKLCILILPACTNQNACVPWLYLQTLHSDHLSTNQNVLCPVYTSKLCILILQAPIKMYYALFIIPLHSDPPSLHQSECMCTLVIPPNSAFWSSQHQSECIMPVCYAAATE